MNWAQGVEYAAEAAGRPGTVLASRRRRCGDRRDATAALLAAFPGRRRSIPRAQGRVGRSTGSRGRLGPHRPIKPATSLAQASISPLRPDSRGRLDAVPGAAAGRRRRRLPPRRRRVSFPRDEDIMPNKKKRSPEDAALYVESLLFGDDPSNSEADVDKYDASDLKGAINKDGSSDEEDFTEEGLSAKEVALSISKSIVSLISSVDGKVLFTCSGTVVDHVGSATWILTSATLVRKCDNDYDAYQEGDVKIEVLLHNKTITEGYLAMCSLQYNIAVVTIEPQFDLPLVKLHDLPVCYSMLCRPVIAVARNFKSKTLLVRCGEMTRERSELDCDELLVCTCPVSKVFIGGLVMDLERRILGITFYDKDTVPFLPIEIAVRCLEHFKNFRYAFSLGFNDMICTLPVCNTVIPTHMYIFCIPEQSGFF